MYFNFKLIKLKNKILMCKITLQELKTTLKLSLIFSLRMSGIFMILPVLTIYASSLQEATAYLIGVAIGIYGLMQIIFQLPFGLMSDRIGHKHIIILGLTIFAIGSEIAALTDNIWGLIVGRALQGSGAISSSLIALLLNSVQENNRTKAIAIMGISFGINFAISIILGPVITNIFGLHGLFHNIAILAILAIILTFTVIPTISTHNLNNTKHVNLLIVLNDLKKIITNIQLMKLNIGVFCLHTILMLNFIILPKIMIILKFMPDIHWKIYSVIIFISACVILPCLFHSKIKNNMKNILILCTNILWISELIMLLNAHHRWIFLLGMQLFFISFNLTEAILPSLISQISSKKYRGTTISIYSIGQFAGVGFGGIIGGLLLEKQGAHMLFLFALIMSITFCIISNTLKNMNCTDKKL